MATKLAPTVQDALNELDQRPKHACFNAALVAAQAELDAPRKDREVTVRMKSGGTYKFSYATMAGMIERDKPVLAKHGLGFVQFVEDGAMVTRIVHESGGFMDCPIPMPSLPNAPQEAGSVITYFKRYSYSAAFGRVADEEDDANIAEGNGYERRDRPSTGETPPNKRVTLDGPYTCPTQLKAAAKEFVRTLEGCGDSDELHAFLETDDAKAFMKQLERDMPDWWETGEGLPGEFIPLKIRIVRRQRELVELDALEGR